MEHNIMDPTTSQSQKFLHGGLFFWFPKGKKEHTKKIKKWWFGMYKIQYCLPNNMVLLVNVDKFE
jgi:hypothetical protein